MPNYLLYTPDVETIADDEHETHAKIIEVMSKGMANTREKYGKSVRISHAKTNGVLKGTLTVSSGLPPELAQGIFTSPKTYEVLVRLANAPGEYNDDSKLSTSRGMSIKVLGVAGAKMANATDNTQDWVLDTGSEFLSGGPKEFLQAFKPNAEIAPKLSDAVKGAVSTVSKLTNEGLNAIGLNSEKLDFYGHPDKHPLAEPYYSQTALRYGAYVAKLGVFPVMPGAEDLEFKPETPDAFREAIAAYFRSHPAEFSVRIQLNTGLDEMPIEDAQAKWPIEASQYQEVARISLPVQAGYDAALDSFVENFSFSPANSLEAHRPLGGINRARLVVYKTLSDLRHAQNGAGTTHAENTDAVPA